MCRTTVGRLVSICTPDLRRYHRPPVPMSAATIRPRRKAPAVRTLAILVEVQGVQGGSGGFRRVQEGSGGFRYDNVRAGPQPDAARISRALGDIAVRLVSGARERCLTE